MIDPKKIEEIAKQIGAVIPPKVREMADDVENKVKQVLQQNSASWISFPAKSLMYKLRCWLKPVPNWMNWNVVWLNYRRKTSQLAKK